MDYKYLTKNNIVVRHEGYEYPTPLEDCSAFDLFMELHWLYLRAEDGEPDIAREHYFKMIVWELAERARKMETIQNDYNKLYNK